MDELPLMLLGLGVLLGAVLLIGLLRRRVPRGVALIINGPGGAAVSFTDRLVLPVLQRAETMDLAVQPIEVDCRGATGLVCHDHIRADITLMAHVRVNRTAEDVLEVADKIGCARATDPQVLRDLFVPRFTEALKSVGGRLEFAALYKDRGAFKDQLLAAIGRDLDGYVLDDLAISHLEMTPIEALDPNNLSDALAIRKITESTTRENMRTNELRLQERLEIVRQDLLADEARARLEQERAEQQARAGQGIHAGFIRRPT